MSDRVLTDNVFTTPLAHDALAPDEVEEGSPTAGVFEWGAVGAAEVGIWEMTNGVARDTESEEIFVVLSGAGTVTFRDGGTVALAPGVAVRLHAGEETVWNITETLRKIFVTIG